MKSRSLWLVIPVLIGLAIAFYYFTRKSETVVPVFEAPVTAPAEVTPPPVQMAPPGPAEDELEPLPALDDSDASVRQSVGAALGEEAIERFLVGQAVVRKLVITVDNLPRESVNMRVRAAPALGGSFQVLSRGEETVIDPANFARYEPFVGLVRSADVGQLADLYVRYYPLFQQAYEELGYPDQQFHNRLMEVIGHLLATPEVSGPIRLVRPHVLYKYADPSLEARSAGQKTLIRMGPDNAAIIKAKLAELETELAARAQPLKPE